MLECVDSSTDKVTDHHEPHSCQSHILWHKVPDPWHMAGQVADRASLEVQHMDTGNSPSYQEEQAVQGPRAPLQRPRAPLQRL